MLTHVDPSELNVEGGHLQQQHAVEVVGSSYIQTDQIQMLQIQMLLQRLGVSLQLTVITSDSALATAQSAKILKPC